MRGNTITLQMTEKGAAHVSGLYQYDYGQRLIISGPELPAAYEVHFSNQERGISKTMIGDSTGVDIPDEYLLTGENIYVWMFLHDGETDGETEYHGVIHVQRRAKPTDLEPAPVQQDAITQAIAALNEAVEQTGQDVIDANAAKEAAEEAVAHIEEIISISPTFTKDSQGEWSCDVPFSEAYTAMRENRLNSCRLVYTVDGLRQEERLLLVFYDEDYNTLYFSKTENTNNNVTGHSITYSSDPSNSITEYTTNIPIVSELNKKQDTPADSGSEGQVLGLDANGKPVWVDHGKGVVEDVKINNVSIVQNGSANIPIANATNPGVVKVPNNTSQGIVMNNGFLQIAKAASNNIKSGNQAYMPITPTNQHEAVFYGLAKAAGDNTQSSSVESVGSYTDDAQTAIQTMLNVPGLDASGKVKESQLPSFRIDFATLEETQLIIDGYRQDEEDEGMVIETEWWNGQQYQAGYKTVTAASEIAEAFKQGKHIVFHLPTGEYPAMYGFVTDSYLELVGYTDPIEEESPAGFYVGYVGQYSDMKPNVETNPMSLFRTTTITEDGKLLITIYVD